MASTASRTGKNTVAAKASVLANPTDLARELGVDRMTIDKYIKKAKLKVVSQYKFGRGQMRLYERTKALDSLRQVIPALTKPVAAPTPIAAKAVVAVPPADLGSLYLQKFEQITVALENLNAGFEAWKVQSTAQKAALLTQISHLREEMDKINKELGVKASEVL